MTGFSYENQGSHTYLSYEIKADETINSMVLGMLTHNKIAGLAETRFTQENETKYLKYDVTAKVTVKNFFSDTVNKKRLLGVFSGVVNALRSAEEYMIDVGDIVLDTDYIFSDVSTYKTVLICLPLEQANVDQPVAVGAFFKQLIFNIQFDQTENCDYVAKIINHLNSVSVFSLKDFSVLLNQLKSDPIGRAMPARSGRPKVNPTQNVGNDSQRPRQPSHCPPTREQLTRPKPNVSGERVGQATDTPGAGQSAEQSRSEARPEDRSGGQKDSEKMSMFYLLRHYNKENLERYKAQSATSGGDGKKVKSSKSNKGGTEKPNVVVPNGKKQRFSEEFVVPGDRKTADRGYAVVNNADDRDTNGSMRVPPKVPVPTRPTESQGRRPNSSQLAQAERRAEPGQRSAGFGDTIIIDAASDDGTILLTTEQEKEPAIIKPHLIRQSNHEKIMIDKSLFRIGRMRDYADYCISDNKAVGRSHANIISRDGAFYIVDINSRNHTYVNGEMIQSNSEVQIEHGTIISLADESFEFRLY